MQNLNVEQLIPGMVIADDVYTYNDQLILPKGLRLTDKSITKLRFYAVSFVKVDDSFAPTSPMEKEAPNTYSNNLKASSVFYEFKENFSNTVSSFKNTINDIVTQNAPIDSKALLSQITALLYTDEGKINIFNMLHNMRQFDDETYTHSINVALICNVFAKWLHMSEEDTEIATLSGLMHDIGKLLIPDSIIKKPGKLTEDEYSIIQTHPIEGYNILKSTDLNMHIKNAALMHHEKCDGSGYPLGLKADKIDAFARLVAIADVYDATTSARIYRGPLCPFEVIGLFQSEGIQKYDVLFIMTFLENVVNTYLHFGVVLSDGTEGIIVFINRQDLSRPIIKSGSKFIDLAMYPTLTIVKIL